MSINQDIKPGELVEVLVGDPEPEEQIAKVLSNEGSYLFVTYLSPTNKIFKSAKVFSFEAKAERVDFESLTTHHKDVIDVSDLGIKKVHTNMFVYEDDIDSESESEIETDESDDDSEGSLKDFIVPDNIDEICKPCDHQAIDKVWSTWRPASAGAQRFKKRVDEIEEFMNHQIDEKFIFKKNF